MERGHDEDDLNISNSRKEEENSVKEDQNLEAFSYATDSECDNSERDDTEFDIDELNSLNDVPFVSNASCPLIWPSMLTLQGGR
jgi:hypothetical protein